MAPKNQLHYGDCLEVMKTYIEDGSVDLVYLDPPFASNRNYNMLYRNRTGRQIPEQVTAFWDTWEWNSHAQQLMNNMPTIARSYEELDANFADFWLGWIKALQKSNKRLLAYLMYMFVRLLEMKRILKPTGSLYYHCDPTASHYIKVILDGIFGPNNFRNEIVWHYPSPGARRGGYFPKKHDTILFYSKGEKPFFNRDGAHVKVPISETSKSMHYKNKDEKGHYRVREVKGKAYRYYLNEGKLVDTVWGDLQAPRSNSPLFKENLGYSTQKSLDLMNRIIDASCPEDGLVYDPFCGYGTTLYASHLNKRNWMGTDITIHAINLIAETLEHRHQLLEGKDYDITGVPNNIDSAQQLFDDNPFEFEKWAVEFVDGVCTKRTNNRSINGKIYFQVEQETHHMALSVKGGATLKPSMVCDLKGTMKREGAPMGGLILLREPTTGMLKEAKNAGKIEYFGTKYSRLQVRTIEQLMTSSKNGKQPFHLPTPITHKNKTTDIS